MEKKKRYSCFTKAQQKKFDGLSVKHQKYILLRAQGNSKKDAYLLSGFEGKPEFAGQGGYKLEKKNGLEPLIAALTSQLEAKDALKEDTPISKKIDARAEGLPAELTGVFSQVDEDSAVVTTGPADPAKMKQADAMNAQFYRRIADGAIKSRKTTTMYDKDGHVVSRKVEETSDISVRMKAHERYCTLMGIGSVIEMGQVDAGDLKILIVDASKKDDVVLPSTEYEDKTDGGE